MILWHCSGACSERGERKGDPKVQGFSGARQGVSKRVFRVFRAQGRAAPGVEATLKQKSNQL